MSSDFRDAAGRFIWSAWGEIGVPSTERRAFDLAIDLEALIRLTGVGAAQDARLISHADRWQSAFPEFVSKARLKRLGEGPESVARGNGRSRLMSGEPKVDLSRESVLQLRVRSALGVSARAELIRQFLVDSPGTRRSSSDLAELCGYTKRNTEKALEALERGGWIARIEGGASLRWSLVDHAALAVLFAPLPASNTSFLALSSIVEDLLVLDDHGSSPVTVRSGAARGVLAGVKPTADWGSVRLPSVPQGVDAWESAVGWVSGLPATAI